jgi:hypothetical protein
MAALFAIQIKEFPHDDKRLNFNGRWIGKYMGKTSVALLCPFTDLLAAGEFATLGVISVISLALWTTPSEFKAALWNLLKKKKPPGPPEIPQNLTTQARTQGRRLEDVTSKLQLRPEGRRSEDLVPKVPLGIKRSRLATAA